MYILLRSRDAPRLRAQVCVADPRDVLQSVLNGRVDVFAFPFASPLVPAIASSIVTSAGPMSGAFDAMSGDFVPAIAVNSFAIARQIAAGTDVLVPGAAPMLSADLERVSPDQSLARGDDLACD